MCRDRQKTTRYFIHFKIRIMANYVPSNLVAAQANIAAAFQAGELRFRDPVVFKSLLAAQPLIMEDDYSALRTREDRSVEVNFFNRTSRALGTGRSHTHSGTKGDTTIITPSFATKHDLFYTSLKQADKNKRTLQEMLNNEIRNVIANFAEGVEQLSADFIFSNRSGVNGVTVEGSFDAVSDVFEIPVASIDRSIQITQMVMDILKYQNMELDIYCDSISYNRFRYAMAQGTGNNQNLQFQFQDGRLNFYHMPDVNASVAALAAGVYNQGFWLVVPKGMAVSLDWIPRQNRQGVSSTTIGGVAEYGTILNPVDGLPYAVHKIWAGADETASNGYTQDVKENYEISIDLAFEKAPLTTASETVIQAFAIV